MNNQVIATLLAATVGALFAFLPPNPQGDFVLWMFYFGLVFCPVAFAMALFQPFEKL
jgi:hypothetical protein